jgi:hypothetical protein
MRPDAVVVDPPRLDLPSRIGHVVELVSVQALVPQLAVEALAVAVLRRLAWRDPVQPHPALVAPMFLADWKDDWKR